VVDAALYEASFSMMESIVPAYDKLKVVPGRTGSRLQSTAPNNLYAAKDGAYVLISANNNKVFQRLGQAMQMPHLADDPRFATVKARATNIDAIDEVVGAWVGQHASRDVQTLLDSVGVPVSLVYTIEDIYQDPHYRERDMLVTIEHPELEHVTLTGVTPKLSTTPGAIHRAGPALAEDTASVLAALLDVDAQELEQLEKDRVIGIRHAGKQR
jgi:crotonobetainyl-CoA:carnitine CoA-transferase CaiB-like acyl-CoA transferase